MMRQKRTRKVTFQRRARLLTRQCYLLGETADGGGLHNGHCLLLVGRPAGQKGRRPTAEQSLHREWATKGALAKVNQELLRKIV